MLPNPPPHPFLPSLLTYCWEALASTLSAKLFRSILLRADAKFCQDGRWVLASQCLSTSTLQRLASLGWLCSTSSSLWSGTPNWIPKVNQSLTGATADTRAFRLGIGAGGRQIHCETFNYIQWLGVSESQSYYACMQTDSQSMEFKQKFKRS